MPNLFFTKALGRNFEMDTSKGAWCLNPIKNIAEIHNMPKLDRENKILVSFYNSIFLTRLALKGNSAVIGYVSGPFSLFVYLVEKVRNGLFETVKTWINSEVEATKKLLNYLVEALLIHIREQINAGAQTIALFELYSDCLSLEDFKAFSYDFVNPIFLTIRKEFPSIPLIYYTKGQTFFLRKLLNDFNVELPFDCLAFDFNCDIEEFADLCEKRKISLSGNLDPGVLMGSPEFIIKKTENMLKNAKKCKKYIASLGHGVYEEIDPKKLELFADTVRKTNIIIEIPKN